jgi:hypothetical protein
MTLFAGTEKASIGLQKNKSSLTFLTCFKQRATTITLLSRMSFSTPLSIDEPDSSITYRTHEQSHCHQEPAPFNVSDGSNSSVSSTKSSVTFGTAYVREYERVLEGRPDVPMALNLGWEYVERVPMTVDDFDRISRQDRIYSTSTSSLQASQTSLQQRFAILHYVHGFSMQELQDAETLRLRHFQLDEEPKKWGGIMFRKLFGRKRDNSKSRSRDDSNSNDEYDDL